MSTSPQSRKTIIDALHARFGETLAVDENLAGLDELARLAGRRVHRRYTERAVDAELLRLLCACALSAPSKSDLQQADIVIVNKADQTAIADLIPDQPFIRTAPAFLVFLANGRRLPEISKMRGKPFPNDHLDQFFNAAVDAGIVLATFIRAADAVGLGTCPISVIRDHSAKVSEMLELPQRVIPVAGMCVGWPSEAGHISPRLSLQARCMKANTTRAISPRASTPTTAAAPRSIRTSRAIRRAGATCRSTAGRRTRRGNTACRSGRISARSCGRRGVAQLS